MRKNQVFKIVLLALGAVLAAVIGFSIVPVTSYLKGRDAPLDAELLAAEEQGADQVLTISDDQLTQLIEGKISLDALETRPDMIVVKPAASSEAQEAASSADSAVPDAEHSSEETGTAASEAAPAASDGSSPAASHSTTQQAAAGGTAATDASYEAEIKALVQQLYSVKGRAEGGLNACISSARSEFKSLPPEQQTQSRKVAICFSKAGQLSALQASCDQEVNSIVSQMRQILKANGQSTALADQAMSTYKSQKSARYSSLMNQLYH